MRTIAIQFSGGKDSLAALHLSKPLLGRATVYFCDSGIYPHVVEFVRETCGDLGATLKIVRPPMPLEDFQAIAGLPSDLVPVQASPELQPYVKRKGKPVLQSHLRCCAVMLFAPLQRAMIEDGVKEVVRGSKASDPIVGAWDGFVENGIVYRCPLWHWSDADVFAYLEEIGAKLPAHYAEGNQNYAWDCMLCTAFLGEPGTKKRLEYTRRHYPDVWPKLAKRLETVRKTVDDERSQLDDAFSIIQDQSSEVMP